MEIILKRAIRAGTYALVVSGVFLLSFLGFHTRSHTSERYSEVSPGIFPPTAHADAPIVTPGDVSGDGIYDPGRGGDDDDDDDDGGY